MAITKRVQTQLSNVLPSDSRSTPQRRSNKNQHQAELVPAALPPAVNSVTPVTFSNSSTTSAQAQIHNTAQVCNANCSNKGKTWTSAEHERFIQALQLYPGGPWKAIAAVVGTKTPRQTMTHAQKCRQKLERHQRGLKIQTRRLVESRQQQQQWQFPSQEDDKEGTNRLQPLTILQEPPRRNASATAAHETALPVDRIPVAHPAAINGAPRDDAAALTHARSHGTSMTSAGADDAQYLTLSWGDAHSRAQLHASQIQQQQQLLQSHRGSMEMVSDFAVIGAFESTDASDMMWGEGSHMSSIGLHLPVAVVDGEVFCVLSNEVADTLSGGGFSQQMWPAS